MKKQNQMHGILMGKGAKAEDRELAEAIAAGKMKNAWQEEDRPHQPDQRPDVWRPQHKLVHSRTYVENYDRVFRRKEDGTKEEERGGEGPGT